MTSLIGGTTSLVIILSTFWILGLSLAKTAGAFSKKMPAHRTTETPEVIRDRWDRSWNEV